MARSTGYSLNGGESTFGACETLTACTSCGGEVYQYSGEPARRCDLCEVNATIAREAENVSLLLSSLSTLPRRSYR